MPRIALALLAVTALTSSACGRMTLHRSFGQRVHDFNGAQAMAHPAHDVVVRGIEVEAILETFTNMYGTTANDASSTNSGGGSGGGGRKTAGISPLN